MVRRSGIGPEATGSTAIRRRKLDLPSLLEAVKRRVTQPSVPLALKLPALLSVEEVAAVLHRHPEVVRRQARAGRLPAEKIGRVWFFRPERLAEAGFTQFVSAIAAGEARERPEPAAAGDTLVRALGQAGLDALVHLERDAIFAAVGGRLAEAGFSTFIFLLSDGQGLTCVFRQSPQPIGDFERVAGQAAVGTFIPFERAPILGRVCQTLRPAYVGDADELVGRMAAAIPTVAPNARRVGEILRLDTMIAAPLVVGAAAMGVIIVVGPGLREADLPAVTGFANQTAAALESARLLEASRRMEEAAVLALAGATELRDAGRGRVDEHAELAERFAERLGLDPAVRRRVRYTALLQDLGKLALPDSILNERGRLDSEERALLITHPIVAADLLQRFSPLAELAPLVRAHHEWFNGEGYPDGRKGEAIPLETRIVSIVNAFFSVSFDLPFKTETTIEEGLEELARSVGIILDPTLTEAFVRMCREAAAGQAPWYRDLTAALLASNAPVLASGPRDILSVADSRELRIIYRIAQETNAVLDLGTLLSRIVNIIRDVMGYYMVSILLPGDDGQDLRVGAHSGYTVDITGLTIPAGQGIIGWVFANGVPQIIPDVKADPRYIQIDEQVRSKLAFPLISRGKVVGVLNAESQYADAFSEADVGLMSAVGSQLASTLEVAQLHDTLKREASHDPLTRLYNRRLFLERIQQEITRAGTNGESFSIVFLDVNELKRINDTYGHLAGDALLREVSSALMDAVRGEDVVARYGGDEFVILLPTTAATAAASVAQRIADGIGRHRFMAGRELLRIPGVSLGVASFPEDGATAEQLLAAADASLYAEKRKAS
jgi:diguanylate cyclase (GGDEF)-like protein